LRNTHPQFSVSPGKWHTVCVSDGSLDRSREERRAVRQVETMLTCDYNGWNDAPEEEREWFDQHPEIWDGPTPVTNVRPLPAARTWLRRKWFGDIAA
jgi:hypothetical protein